MMENDLISRSALMEAIAAEFLKTDPAGEEQIGYLECHRIVREFPAVDAVEVVRCKDCVYVELPKCCPYQINGFAVIPEWYCPMGVKTPAEVEG